MSEIQTDSGIEIKPVYRAEDAGDPQPDPGQFPYTRGIYPTMYRGRLEQRWASYYLQVLASSTVEPF